MRYSEYENLSSGKKEIHNFDVQQAILANVKRINGDVADLKKWRWFLAGGLTILGVLFPYLTFIK